MQLFPQGCITYRFLAGSIPDECEQVYILYGAGKTYLFINLSLLIAGTAFLWWTYFDIKNSLDADKAMNIPLLPVDVSNKDAFLVFSITATVLTVSQIQNALLF